MTNDQFPSAGESFPGMIDPIIARRARPRNFESRTSRFPRVLAKSFVADESPRTKRARARAHFVAFYYATPNGKPGLFRQ